MEMSKNKKGIFIICLSLVLILVIAASIFRYSINHENLSEPKPDSINTSSNRAANATIINTRTINNETSNTRTTSDTNTDALTGSTNTGEVGNANYFNEKDGKYYADSKYKIEANDNTVYILKLFKSEKDVDLPAGNFLCTTKIVLNGKDLSVSGIEGKSKIVFDSITFKNYGHGATAESLIINKNYADEYKADSAQNINISGITFEYKRYSSNSPKTMMLFKNIKGAYIKNCSFIADLGNEIPVTNLDLYNGCKNVTVDNCYFFNKTKADSGGCIWVRNLTAQMNAVTGNTTENIIINKCSFNKDSKDEVIAVYSTVGDVKDVTISNCDIKDYSTNQDIVMLVYSSEDKYYGTVDNVIINNNNIYSQNFNSFIILTGIDNRVNPTKNVIITNNKIVAESQSNKRKSIIYNSITNKDSSIIVSNNEITASGSSYLSAIANVTFAGGNKITGTFENGIVRGGAINNTISGAVNGIVDPIIALSNTISQVKYGIKVNQGDSYINSNTISLEKDIGVCGIEVISQNYVVCTKNTIQTLNKNQYGIIAKNTNTILYNNVVLGEGKNIIK